MPPGLSNFYLCVGLLSAAVLLAATSVFGTANFVPCIFVAVGCFTTSAIVYLLLVQIPAGKALSEHDDIQTSKAVIAVTEIAHLGAKLRSVREERIEKDRDYEVLKNQLAENLTKERLLKLRTAASRLTLELSAVNDICAGLTKLLSQDSTLVAICVLRVHDWYPVEVAAHYGFTFTEHSLVRLSATELVSKVIGTNEIIELTIKPAAAENLTDLNHVTRLALVRAAKSAESTCIILAFLTTSSLDKQTRFKQCLEAVVDSVSSTLAVLLKNEDIRRRLLTDSLTFMLNRDALLEMLRSTVKSAIQTSIAEGSQALEPAVKIAGVLVEVDEFDTVHSPLGALHCDSIAKRVCEVICSVTGVRAGEPTTCFPYSYRISGGRFFIWTDATETARALTTRLRASFEERSRSERKPLYTVSLIAGEIPLTELDAVRMLGTIENALSYLRERNISGATTTWDAIPRRFFNRTTSGTCRQIFDPFAVIELFAADESTGVLTVQSRSSAPFRAEFENGKLRFATTGDIMGDQAIIEFLTNFTEADFDFQPGTKLALPASKQGTMPDTTVNQPIEHLLERAACVLEHYEQDKLALGRSSLTVFPLIKPADHDKLMSLKHMNAPCDDEELAVCREMMKSADGNKTLQHLFDNAGAIPQAVKWRCARLLRDNGFIRVTAFKAHGGISSRT